MATTMTKGTTRGNAAVSGTNQYLKKGGKVKKYDSGGPFIQKKKVTDEEGNSVTNRTIRNPVTRMQTNAVITRSADGQKTKRTVKESYKKKGGMVKSKKK